ncbi:MAG TPA: DUF4918 family protein [Campylobacterales bacterium]|nr:DUF4918 family protein [Campylobacterales bacterium]
MTWAAQIIDFYMTMSPDQPLPKGIETIYPYSNAESERVTRIFYEKYYNDTKPRGFLIGINPGRIGAGTTGIGFTDPVTLEEYCDIPNSFEKRKEVSAQFIFEVIRAYGGVEKFYQDFYITATMPLGLLKNDKNYNYYDDKKTEQSLEPFIRESMEKQLAFGAYYRDAICIGQGKNLAYLEKFNEQYEVFDSILTVPHPRWVMQYRRKEMAKYIDVYLEALAQVLISRSVR